jgi:hypothetical protein
MLEKKEGVFGFFNITTNFDGVLTMKKMSKWQ